MTTEGVCCFRGVIYGKTVKTGNWGGNQGANVVTFGEVHVVAHRSQGKKSSGGTGNEVLKKKKTPDT